MAKFSVYLKRLVFVTFACRMFDVPMQGSSESVPKVYVSTFELCFYSWSDLVCLMNTE